MTHRFPDDFWTGRDVRLQNGYRLDGSLSRRLGWPGPLGFSPEEWRSDSPQDEFMMQFIDEAVLDDEALGDEPMDEGPYRACVENLHPEGQPTGLFIPEKYEPRYPYPVILWFHEAGGNESQLLSIMPQISHRNYVGLSLQGTVSLEAAGKSGFDWPSEPLALKSLEQSIFQTVCELRRQYHVHSERVFLAGAGAGASVALSLMFRRAEWFAGVFALGGNLPAFDPQLLANPELREKRMWLTTFASEQDSINQSRQQTTRLWQTAGMNLVLQMDQTSPALAPARLAQLNHWVMESICTPV